MLYDISLSIDYDYENAAGSSRHIVRLMPADLAGDQQLLTGNVSISPQPDEIRYFTDFFGNNTADVSFIERHDAIRFSVTAQVERQAQAKRFDTSTRCADLGSTLRRTLTLGRDSPHHFVAASPRVALEAETTAFARAVVAPDMGAHDAVIALGQALHAEFRFAEGETTVDTPMIEAFRNRSGVCQDFSHIMIAALRGVGIPAGYVSGFLRTLPPEGQARLEGADAMHAWVRAWCGPDMGWIEYDPTNACLVGEDHIVVARGRDYFDVAPVKGVMRSWGAHTTRHMVDVVPVGES